MNPKSVIFGLLSFASCAVVFLLAVLNWMMTSLWLQGFGDVYTWAGVAIMSILGLILLWRAASRTHHRYKYISGKKSKEKNAYHERLELQDIYEDETFQQEQQSHRKSKP